MSEHIKSLNIVTLSTLIFLFTFYENSNAQGTPSGGTTANEASAAAGSYQLVFNSKSDEHPVQVTASELIKIESLRKDDEVVFAFPSYSDDKGFRILPRNMVNQLGFTPLTGNYYKDEQPYEEIKSIRYVVFD